MSSFSVALNISYLLVLILEVEIQDNLPGSSKHFGLASSYFIDNAFTLVTSLHGDLSDQKEGQNRHPGHHRAQRRGRQKQRMRSSQWSHQPSRVRLRLSQYNLILNACHELNHNNTKSNCNIKNSF